MWMCVSILTLKRNKLNRVKIASLPSIFEALETFLCESPD